MKIATVTLTGADNTVDPSDLRRLSHEFPIVEWAILLSETRAGTPRYPDAAWLTGLKDVCDANGSNRFSRGQNRFRLAAHLCGATMRRFVPGISNDRYDGGAWLEPFGLGEISYNQMFERTQVNFSARREGFGADELTSMLEGWYEAMDGTLITQDHPGNPGVWQALQKKEQESFGVIRAHQVLHDASGGNGARPTSWPKPIAGLLNGYAGGIGPSNIIETLEALEPMVGDGYIWIDMESSLRGPQDDFSLDLARTVLEQVLDIGTKRDWL